MNSYDALTTLQGKVPECVAVGLVHMTTGMLLGLEGAESHRNPILELVAAASGELYRGSNVSAIEALFKPVGSSTAVNDDYFQEIVIIAEDLVHVLQRCRKREHLVLVVVCRRSGSLGSLLTRARRELDAVEGFT